MSFLLPLGLLALSSVIALIIIWIIKPKYHEKTISSTLIWELSLKYQKRKMPFQWLKQSLLLLLQILILVILSFMLAKPFIKLNTRGGEKIFILDCSASMQAVTNGETRFDKAKKEILKTVGQKTDEDKITIILAEKTATFAVRRENANDVINKVINEAECSYTSSDVASAISLANGVLTENPSAEIILYTDVDYVHPGYVTVKNMSEGEWNVSVLSFNAELKNGFYQFSADVASYNRAANVTVKLIVNGVDRDDKKIDLEQTRTVYIAQNASQTVVWHEESDLQVYSFEKATIAIYENDSFGYDNSLTVYGKTRRRYVELISEYPNMLNVALLSNPENSVFQASLKPTPNIYESGYDLYLYEGYMPEKLPTDGALIIVNPTSSAFGFTVGGEVSMNCVGVGNDTLSATYRSIMGGITPRNIKFTKYTKITSCDGYDVLMTCNGDPTILVNEIDGTTVIVLAFDIHYSDLPMLLDFPLLVNNACDYAAPLTLDKYLYETGDVVSVHTKPNAVSATLTTAEKTEEYERLPFEFTCSKPGEFTIVQNLSNGKVRTDTLFARIPSDESNFAFVGDTLAPDKIPFASETDIEYNSLQLIRYLAMLLLLLIAVEWGVQYHEQF